MERGKACFSSSSVTTGILGLVPVAVSLEKLHGVKPRPLVDVINVLVSINKSLLCICRLIMIVHILRASSNQALRPAVRGIAPLSNPHLISLVFLITYHRVLVKLGCASEGQLQVTTVCISKFYGL
jgi:hypothetical protein